MTTPSVIEKQNIDIKLTGGVNERYRKEVIDWTKHFTVAKNVVFKDAGALSTRPGFNSTAAAAGSVFRLYALNDGLGLGVTASTQQKNLYQVAEYSNTLINKGNIPEYSVTSEVMSSWTDQDTLAICGVGLTTRYKILLHAAQVQGSSSRDFLIVIKDRYSNNVVKTYGVGGTGGKAWIAVVSNRYLHIYQSDAINSSAITVVDTEALPSVLPASTNLTMAGTDPVQVVVDSTNNRSIVVGTGGEVEVFSSTGVSVTSGTVVGFTTITDVYCYAADKIVILGVNATPDFIVKFVTASTVTVTRTVTDTTSTTSAAGSIARICADNTGVCRIIEYSRTASTVGVYIPTAKIWSLGLAGTTFTAIGSLVGWMELSLPFYSGNRAYCVFGKQVSAVTAASAASRDSICNAAVLVDITDVGDGSLYSLFAFRPCAVLDNYTQSADQNEPEYGHYYKAALGAVLPPNRPCVDTSGNIYTALTSKISARFYGHSFITLKANDLTVLNSAVDILSGGLTGTYDGFSMQETCWVDMPTCLPVDSGGGTGVDNGTRTYVAVYEFKDYQGNSHYSRTSRVSQLTMGAAHDVTVQVTAPHVYSHARGVVRVYRTVAGGTSFYLCGSLQFSGASTTAFFTLTDSMSDATLINQPLLFRQPGVSNTALDRYHPLASSCVCRHKDRVFYANGNTVYYSSFAVDGESPWFSPAFSFPVPGGSGAIKALASMDGVLVVFKQDAIFVVDGDGPPENGGSGTEFSPPRKILTEFGCVDQRTLVATPSGLMYRSNRGIELLTRSLQVNWIGDRVKDSVDSHVINGGACFDAANGRVLFPVSTTDNNSLVTGDAQPVLCYDIATDAWTTFELTTGSFQDLVWAQAGLGTSSNAYQLFASAGRTYGRLTDDSWKDYDTTFIPWTLETGWIHGQTLQDRLKITDLYLIGQMLSNHNIVVSAAYNYKNDYTVLKTFTPSTINPLDVEQLNLNLPRQELQSVRFKIQTSLPTDTVTYPIQTGEQLDLVGLSVRLGIKGQGAKLSNEQKG